MPWNDIGNIFFIIACFWFGKKLLDDAVDKIIEHLDFRLNSIEEKLRSVKDE